ncbi:type II toxin-antitoxin system HicB family antitoxin [Candidatus Bipolaricaulota bacterium]|nr:type II toxin-antitoxin system HicB family antitoxin [Candidatus Bipolaricaulota bacterium]
MRFEGRVFKSGQYWAIEVPILSVVTQGQTKKEAFEMIADAIEVLVNKPAFEVRVFPGKGEYFEVGASDEATLTAFLLRRERTKSGLTLAEVARRLGSKSLNTYARYEQGRSVPTVPKLSELLSALVSGKDFVLRESRAQYTS